MAPHPVLIDTSDDFAFAVPSMATPAKRNLLLAPPSVAAHEERLREIFTAFDRANTDLQMLDRLSAGFVSLPAASYDLVLVLTGADGSRGAEFNHLLNRHLFTSLVPAMKVNGRLQFQDGQVGAAESKEAILAGLIAKDGGFEKQEEEEVVIPLRFGKKKAPAPAPVPKFDFSNLDDDDDDLIDENNLLGEEDLKRRPQARMYTHRPLSMMYHKILTLSSDRLPASEAPPPLQRLHMRPGRQIRSRRKRTTIPSRRWPRSHQARYKRPQRAGLYRQGQNRLVQ